MKQDYLNKQFVLQQSNQSRTKQYYYYNTASYSRGQSYIHWAYIFNQCPSCHTESQKIRTSNYSAKYMNIIFILSEIKTFVRNN